MSDDDLILRIESQTFADDSFKIHDPLGLIVDAELAGWSELRWHNELVQKCGDDLKWAKVRHYWSDLSSELRRAVLRDVRDSLIIVVDPRLYRFDLEQTFSLAVRRPRAAWPVEFAVWAEEQIVDYEIQSILSDSPVSRIEYFLEDDSVILGDADAIEDDDDANPSIVTELREGLQNRHNVRLFGKRSTNPVLSAARG